MMPNKLKLWFLVLFILSQRDAGHGKLKGKRDVPKKQGKGKRVEHLVQKKPLKGRESRAHESDYETKRVATQRKLKSKGKGSYSNFAAKASYSGPSKGKGSSGFSGFDGPSKGKGKSSFSGFGGPSKGKGSSGFSGFDGPGKGKGKYYWPWNGPASPIMGPATPSMGPEPAPAPAPAPATQTMGPAPATQAMGPAPATQAMGPAPATQAMGPATSMMAPATSRSRRSDNRGRSRGSTTIRNIFRRRQRGGRRY